MIMDYKNSMKDYVKENQYRFYFAPGVPDYREIRSVKHDTGES